MDQSMTGLVAICVGCDLGPVAAMIDLDLGHVSIGGTHIWLGKSVYPRIH